MFVCVSVLRCDSSGGWRRLERGRGRSKKSACPGEGPGRVGTLGERGGRGGGVSGFGLGDEWARDEWRETAAAKGQE